MQKKDFLNDLGKLIAIPSVKSAPQTGMPFGEGPAAALRFMLGLANDMGFETVNYDNYIGEVVYGDGDKTMGILCHLDVVPEGNGWHYPAFAATIVDDRIYGRGTMDDKTPALICLYALKQLKDEGFVPNCKIKLILGTDEESGWGCIDHYLKVAKMPDFGFSPDADFPVIYAEKGIMHLTFRFAPLSCGREIYGGDRPNMVCARAYLKADVDEKTLATRGLFVENDAIVSVGKNAHGSTPHLGVNAIPALLSVLSDLGEDVSPIIEGLFQDKYGLKTLEDETGKLTMSPNLIRSDETGVYLTVDIRYPATLSRETVLSIAKNIAPFTIEHEQAPLFNDKESFLIKTLLSVYEEVSGKPAKAIAIGGGTYARALPIGAAFGPELPDAENTVHQPDEYVTMETIDFMYDCYLKAILRLTKSNH